jgi:hypothetical protein
VHLPTRPLNGTTPLLDSINAEAEAKPQSAAEPAMPPPHTPSQEEVQRQIDEMANPSRPHQLINKLPPAEAGPPAAPSPISTSPELQRSMSQLDQAIRELQERARQQARP